MVNVTASYSSKTFSFEGSKKLLDFFLVDSRILYFWYVFESIPKFIIELYALQCLFVRRSNKKQRRGRIISNFTKGETFSSLLQPSAFGHNCTMWLPSGTLQERSSSLFLFGQEENIPGHSIESRAYWFILKIVRMFLILMSRNSVMNAFTIVNITPTCKK